MRRYAPFDACDYLVDLRTGRETPHEPDYSGPRYVSGARIRKGARREGEILKCAKTSV